MHRDLTRPGDGGAGQHPAMYLEETVGHLVKRSRDAYPMTPATAAGVTDHVWKIEEIAALLGA
jgi:hypothetical protein